MTMTQDKNVGSVVAALVSIIGPLDPRMVSFNEEPEAGSVERLAHSLLTDKALGSPVVNLALRLASLRPSPVIVGDVVEILRMRPGLALAAGRALNAIRDRASMVAVGAILLDMALAPECRAGAAVALGWLPDEATKKVLTRALLEPEQDADVIVHVISSLGSIQVFAGERDAAEDIGRFLKSDSPDVRFSAVRALGNIRAMDMIDRIAPLASDRELTAFGHAVCAEAQRVIRLLRNP
jgi:hypothetical protein